MGTRTPYLHAALIGAMAVSTGALAASAPLQLHNKTIVVSFLLAPPGAPVRPLSVQRLIYVSSTGQISVRGTRSVGAATETTSAPIGNYRFEGSRIVGHFTMADHANRISIGFDPSFRSCEASLVFGKLPGRSYKQSAPTGVTITTKEPPTVSGMTCTIRDGNVQ